MSIKRLLKSAALLALLSVTMLAAPAFAQTKIRIGLIGTNESQLPIWIAIDKGYFKAENLDVETVPFRGGGIAVQAFIGGSIDLAAFATDHVLRLNNRGIEARFLIGIDRFITYTIIVPAGKNYKDLSDLKGKKIGVSAPGSYSDNILRWSLKTLGINPDRDVTWRLPPTCSIIKWPRPENSSSSRTGAPFRIRAKPSSAASAGSTPIRSLPKALPARC